MSVPSPDCNRTLVRQRPLAVTTLFRVGQGGRWGDKKRRGKNKKSASQQAAKNLAGGKRRQARGVSTAFPRSGGDSPYDSDSMGSQSSMGGSDTGGISDEEDDMDVSTNRNSAWQMPPPRSIARGIALGRSQDACSEAYPPCSPCPNPTKSPHVLAKVCNVCSHRHRKRPSTPTSRSPTTSATSWRREIWRTRTRS